MTPYSYSEIDETGAFIEGGETRLFYYPMKEKKPQVVEADGKRWMRDVGADHRKSAHRFADYHIESLALAVLPEQIPEAMAFDRELGVKVDYNPKNGRPIFTDRGTRRRYCQGRGVIDLDGGYSDP